MKGTLKVSSPAGTPPNEIIYVIEESQIVGRTKVRAVDLDRELAAIDSEISLKQARKTEILDIKAEIAKL